ncbi:hypothetical protein RJ639_043868 [Escallonia herrerae]|uniref:SANTA domain-containing protein n=1 Tax=Escallonia herrerae TaxID=1293975 RepID=A0AA88WEE8_9ASTE|nr:hypothetical protein RJ639_043868 [Escallonia herrerae]
MESSAPSSSNRAIPNQIQKSPSLLRTVWLHDWWLIKAELDSEGRQLGVGGKLGIRVFGSAAIAKRHDLVTLETVDGITIKISGFINRSHAQQNGFPSAISYHFRLGFPYNWEEYAARYFGEDFANRAVPSIFPSLDGLNVSSDSGGNKFFPASLDDLPVTRVRDLLMFGHGNSEDGALIRSIFNSIHEKPCGNACKTGGPTVHSDGKSDGGISDKNPALDKTQREEKRKMVKRKYEDNSYVLDENSVLAETPRDKKRKVNWRYEDDSDVSYETPSRTGDSQKIYAHSKMYVGVATRSMTGSKSLRNKQVDNRLSGNLRKSSRSKVSASSVSHVAMLSQEEIEVKGTPDKSALRRSSRQKNAPDIYRAKMGTTVKVRVSRNDLVNTNLKSSLTRPMKKRTATSPDRTASYRIQDRLKAIRHSKLFPDEKTPTSITRFFLGIGGALRCSTSAAKSRSSETGKPLAKADTISKPPATLTPLTDHGSSFCICRNGVQSGSYHSYSDYKTEYYPVASDFDIGWLRTSSITKTIKPTWNKEKPELGSRTDKLAKELCKWSQFKISGKDMKVNQLGLIPISGIA